MQAVQHWHDHQQSSQVEADRAALIILDLPGEIRVHVIRIHPSYANGVEAVILYVFWYFALKSTT